MQGNGWLQQIDQEMQSSEAKFVELLDGAAIAILSPREATIVRLRYGLAGGDVYGLQEIGTQIGVSGERVRQLLNKALRRLRGAGNRQLRLGNFEAPAGKLLSNLPVLHCSEANVVAEQLVLFSDSQLPHLPVATHAIPLLANLAISDKRLRDEVISIAKAMYRERLIHQRYSSVDRKRSVFFENLLMQVDWPTHVINRSFDDFIRIERQRDVSREGEGHAGHYYSEKLQSLVQYESQLEMQFLFRLERSDRVVFYREQPCSITYRIGTQQHLYYPDVIVLLRDGRVFVVEVKPVFQMALYENLVKWNGLRNYCEREGYGMLVTNGRLSLREISGHSIKPEYEAAMLERLLRGPMRWPEYLMIRERFQPSRRDFAALILRNRLIWRLRPFDLRRSDGD